MKPFDLVENLGELKTGALEIESIVKIILRSNSFKKSLKCL
jgi:hypothetical protein